jgi:hypothetical protein
MTGFACADLQRQSFACLSLLLTVDGRLHFAALLAAMTGTVSSAQGIAATTIGIAAKLCFGSYKIDDKLAARTSLRLNRVDFAGGFSARRARPPGVGPMDRDGSPHPTFGAAENRQ